MGIKEALLAGVAAGALLLLGAACQDAPVDTPGAPHTPTPTATQVAPTAIAPTLTPAIRPKEWAVATEGRPLHEAVIAGSRADVEGALDEGADVNATATVQIHTPTGLEVSGLTPLHLASALNDSPEVAVLLLDRGADIEAKNDDGDTPCKLAREREEFRGTPALDRLCVP